MTREEALARRRAPGRRRARRRSRRPTSRACCRLPRSAPCSRRWSSPRRSRSRRRRSPACCRACRRRTGSASSSGLCADYARDERGLQVVEVAGGYQITTRPEYNDWVRELLDPRTPTRLSIQALETLAVIAYKQPVTLPEIIELRGVKSGGVVKTLLEKRLIRITGPQGGRRPADPLRHDEAVPAALRPQGPRGAAQDRGVRRGARRGGRRRRPQARDRVAAAGAGRPVRPRRRADPAVRGAGAAAGRPAGRGLAARRRRGAVR